MSETTAQILNKLGDYEILETVENALRDLSTLNDVGYFTGEVDRDEKGLKIVLRVAAMVDSAGEEDFKTNEQLKTITAQFPEGPVLFDVVETVNVSGMEMEVVYRPR